jgi:BMFP domain-containing protein YqiC
MEARVEDLEAQQAAAAPTAPQGMTDAKIAQLKELAQLREAGVLTEAEFEVQKQKLLQS